MGCRKLSVDLKHFRHAVSINIATPPGQKLWQRNYYEHIIRNDDELNRIREYIINNPLKWEVDRNHPENIICVWNDNKGHATR